MTLLRSIRFWIGIIVSALSLFLALHDVPFDHLAQSLGNAQYLWLVPAAVFQLLSVAARSQRWVVLLKKDGKLADSFWAQGIGYLFTNIFPFRLGEPARVMVMSDRCSLPIVQVATSAMVERLLDVIMVLFILILVLPWMKVPTLVAQAGISFGVFVIVAVIALLVIIRHGDRGEQFLRATCLRLKFLPAKQIIGYWQQIIKGLLPLAHWKTAAKSVIWSAISWAVGTIVYLLVILSFQPNGTLAEAAFMIVTLSLAVTVPSSPGFVGIFQLVGQQALVLPFDGKYDPTMALAITLTTHLTYYLLTTGLGIIGLWRLGESFGNLGQAIMARRANRKTAPHEAI